MVNRVLSGICEITTGTLSVASQPPLFQGENGALHVSVEFEQDGEDVSLSGVEAGMYLFWPEKKQMSELVSLQISGNVATGSFAEVLTAISGWPVLVIQLTDSGTGVVLVSCSHPIHIAPTRGDVVLAERAPTPSEVVYVGRAPYVNTTTNTWMVYNNSTAEYENSGVQATGTTPQFSIVGVTTLDPGSDAHVRLGGTAEAPTLEFEIPKGYDGTGAVNTVDGIFPVSGNVSLPSFSGTDGSSAGSAGKVPAPSTSDTGKFLSSSGGWANVPPYVLPQADTNTLGGIMVGSRLSISNGVLSADDQTAGLLTIVYSDTEPQNPTTGMIWLSPEE